MRVNSVQIEVAYEYKKLYRDLVDSSEMTTKTQPSKAPVARPGLPLLRGTSALKQWACLPYPRLSEIHDHWDCPSIRLNTVPLESCHFTIRNDCLSKIYTVIQQTKNSFTWLHLWFLNAILHQFSLHILSRKSPKMYFALSLSFGEKCYSENPMSRAKFTLVIHWMISPSDD